MCKRFLINFSLVLFFLKSNVAVGKHVLLDQLSLKVRSKVSIATYDSVTVGHWLVGGELGQEHDLDQKIILGPKAVSVDNSFNVELLARPVGILSRDYLNNWSIECNGPAGKMIKNSGNGQKLEKTKFNLVDLKVKLKDFDATSCKFQKEIILTRGFSDSMQMSCPVSTVQSTPHHHGLRRRALHSMVEMGNNNQKENTSTEKSLGSRKEFHFRFLTIWEKHLKNIYSFGFSYIASQNSVLDLKNFLSRGLKIFISFDRLKLKQIEESHSKDLFFSSQRIPSTSRLDHSSMIKYISAVFFDRQASFSFFDLPVYFSAKLWDYWTAKGIQIASQESLSSFFMSKFEGNQNLLEVKYTTGFYSFMALLGTFILFSVLYVWMYLKASFTWILPGNQEEVKQDSGQVHLINTESRSVIHWRNKNIAWMAISCLQFIEEKEKYSVKIKLKLSIGLGIASEFISMVIDFVFDGIGTASENFGWRIRNLVKILNNYLLVHSPNFPLDTVLRLSDLLKSQIYSLVCSLANVQPLRALEFASSRSSNNFNCKNLTYKQYDFLLIYKNNTS